MLTIVSHFLNSPDKVEAQVEHWKKIDPVLLPLIEFILVDDCSSLPPTIDRGALNLRFFRVDTDIQWNQGGSRNLAAFHALGAWGLFFDIDQRLRLDAVAVLLGGLDRLDKDTMYYLRAEGVFDANINEEMNHHINTYLVNMQRFKTYGMLDEDFSGHYGYEDLYLPRVWESSGRKRGLLDSPVFFEDLGFRTADFSRDLERNKKLAHEKLAAGCKNSPGILRFEWHEIVL